MARTPTASKDSKANKTTAKATKVARAGKVAKAPKKAAKAVKAPAKATKAAAKAPAKAPAKVAAKAPAKAPAKATKAKATAKEPKVAKVAAAVKPAKAAKAVEPVKALKKLLKALRSREDEQMATLVADLGALLDASPELLASVDSLAFVAHAAQERQFDVMEMLLARGADPTRKTREDNGSVLAELMSASSVEPARMAAIADQLVARGVDPNDRSGRTSALDRAAGNNLAAVETMLRLGVDQAAVRAALHVAVPAAVKGEDPEAAPVLTRLLAAVTSVDETGEDGLSALHIVALRGTPALVEQALARSEAPGHTITAASDFSADGCSPPGGGIVPQVLLGVGFTARDAVAAVFDMYDAAVAWYGEKGYSAKERTAARDRLAAVLALLVARGLPLGTPVRGELPGFVAEVDALLARLASHVGGDPAAVQRTAAAVQIEDVGPWSYSSAILERSRANLLRGAVGEHVHDSWLAHMISGEHRKFQVEREEKFGWKKPDASLYPEAARRPIELGLIVGGRGDSLLLVWRHAEGVARIGVAAPDGFTLLGDDVLDFLRRELTALGVAIDDIAAGPSVGPGGRAPKLLRADYNAVPGPQEINRVGGTAIGIAEWPMFEGAPMHHVLTIDLREHPYGGGREAHALALFVSSPMSHEAYTPGNQHTRVVILEAADLARGETPLPAALAGADLLPAGTLRFESAAGLTDKERYQHSFLGGEPIWLQGDESEFDDGGDDDYDEDDDEDGDGDDGDERPRRGPIGSFVLQFDESLIPGINLGDCGIMYVFSESAWFQCH